MIFQLDSNIYVKVTYKMADRNIFSLDSPILFN
jgi:hypothetical protein